MPQRRWARPPLRHTPGVSVLVDEAVWPYRGQLWAHLVSDLSYDELHEFAGLLGVPRRAFQGDHYDVPAPLRDRALRMGAEPVSSRVLVCRLRAAGLRRRPNRSGAVPPA
jgi:hypothetical protein